MKEVIIESSNHYDSQKDTEFFIYEVINTLLLQFVAGWDVCALSMPGKALASFLNSALMLNPAFALLSMNMIPSFDDRSSPSSTETWRLSERSVLFPTSTIITSFPRSFLTSSIHFEVFKNDARSISEECKNNVSELIRSLRTNVYKIWDCTLSSTYSLCRTLPQPLTNLWYMRE